LSKIPKQLGVSIGNAVVHFEIDIGLFNDPEGQMIGVVSGR